MEMDDLLEEIPEDRINSLWENMEKQDQRKEEIDMQFSLEELHEDLNLKMPELFPMSDVEHLNDNIIANGTMPELFPIPDALLEKKSQNEEQQSSNKIKQEVFSRHSSTSSSFIDSLLEKIRSSDSTSGFSSSKLQTAENSSTEEDLLVEIEEPITFNQSSNPNMLATPVVKNQRVASAFVNSDEEYHRTVEKNKQKQRTEINDKSKMNPKSRPPKMQPPKLPTNIQKPRTLAEKRMLVNSNIDFLIIEQESKIYKHVQRKIAGKEMNYYYIDSIMYDDVPIKHGAFKALAWLRTVDGNYIQQYINIDGKNYKLCGSRGNHTDKFLIPQSNQPFQKYQTTSLRSLRCCEGGKIKKRFIDNLVSVESIRRFILEETVEPYKRLETKSLFNQLSSIQPRPLTKKIEFLNKNKKMLKASEDSTYLGDYAKYQMPDIKLEVTTQTKVPLDSLAKQYLNEILPHRDLNENWINFSLSTLKQSGNEDQCENGKNSFEFVIPYQGDKRNILVREILKAKEITEHLRILDSSEDDIDEMEWTFAANADKNDPLEMEIVDVIKDLTNSTFINLNDDLFTMEDPHDRVSNVSVISPKKAKEAIDELSVINAKNDISKKILTELRRLNANVVKSENVDDEEAIRRQATAHLGKEERELRPTVILTNSETVLLNSKDKDVKRKKKVPKKFTDYLHTGSTTSDYANEHEPPKKIIAKELQDEPYKAKVQPNSVAFSHDEVKSVKQELRKWLHVNVELHRLKHLEDVQPWCLIHNVYKCSCKGVPVREPAIEQTTVEEPKVHLLEPIDEKPHVTESPSEPSEEIEENSARRVLPIETNNSVDLKKIVKNGFVDEVTAHDDLHESPRVEILNLHELINGGSGPIFINIFDTKSNRLNQTFRTILNNKRALVYIDGFAYYVDLDKINTFKLNFDGVKDELDHPIFIIQPKFPTSVQGTLNDSLHPLLARNKESVIEIKNKIVLKEIADSIENILHRVRKKIEMQIEGEPSELVKDQLSMITRDRINSLSTVSSASTSPLHFNGKQLNKAPAPGYDTPTMKEFNRIFSIRMQKICAILKSNSLGMRLLDGCENKFHIYQWNLLLQSFEENLIHVWQAKVEGESGQMYYLLVITDTPATPEIENVDNTNVVNVKKLSLSDEMTEVTRMILLRLENDKTKNMTILLYGCKTYFRVCGILNGKNNYFDGFVAKPTRNTHPRLTAKIQKIYNFWYGLRLKASENSKIRENGIKEMEVDVMKQDAEKMLETKNAQEESQTVSRNVLKNPAISEFKWFLFNISNDFSDIYIKNWKLYLSYKVVIDAINKAKSKQKSVALVVKGKENWPKIFALHAAPLKFNKPDNKCLFLLFGPYLRSANSNLSLMQNFNGEMLSREEYERINSIKREERTRCIWIYANSLRCVNRKFVDEEPIYLMCKKNRKEDNVTHGLKINSVVGGFKSGMSSSNDFS